MAQVFRNRLAEGSPTVMLQSNTSSYIRVTPTRTISGNWVAPYYGGWDDIPENILAAVPHFQLATGLPAGPIWNPGPCGHQGSAGSRSPDGKPRSAYFFVTDLKGNYYYAHTLEAAEC